MYIYTYLYIYRFEQTVRTASLPWSIFRRHAGSAARAGLGAEKVLKMSLTLQSPRQPVGCGGMSKDIDLCGSCSTTVFDVQNGTKARVPVEQGDPSDGFVRKLEQLGDT